MYSSSILLIFAAAQVISQPLDIPEDFGMRQQKSGLPVSLQTDRNIVEATLLDNAFTKTRSRRGSEEDCEKLSLCKLHANSEHSFIDTFELYFVNKENARLWDHKTHTVQDCEQHFTKCYESEPAAKSPTAGDAAPHASKKEFRQDDSDEEYY